MITDPSRRNFIKTSAAAAAGGLIPGSVLGANEKINLAMIGCGGRGGIDARNLIDAGANMVCLCDVNPERLDQMAEFLGEAQTIKPRRTGDMREVFDSKDIDAVLIATPDHWHAPAAIMACQAGKDVYVEKPHAHNMRESRLLMEASRRYGRIVQVGTQSRSCPYTQAAREYIASGKLGGIHLVKVYNLKPGKPFIMKEAGDMPQGMDWDQWLGPAPERPWHQNIYKRGWHHFWDYSGGDMADDGIHQLDLAMMAMGETAFPGKVSCIGGKKAFPDADGEVPDTQVVSYDFDRFIMTFELTEWPRYMRKTTGTIRRNDELPYWTQNSTRVELYGTELMMTLGRHGGGWQVTTSGGKVVEQMYGRPGDEPHAVNFLECVKTRKAPNADVAIAHKSISLVHTANIAHRIGNQSVQFDGKTEKFVGNSAANALLGRTYRKGYEI